MPGRWRHAVAVGAIAVVAIVQLAHGVGRLEPNRRRAALHLEESSGFYAWETDETGRRYRWIGEKATITVPTTRRMIRVLVRARHPDLPKEPVPVWFTVGGKLAANRYIKTGDWQWIEFEVPEGVSDPDTLAIHVGRTWKAEGDSRPIGIAVARVENIDAVPAARE
jgi:hypothetical protein